ncbi:MAG: hypothetical protein ACREQN_07260 [Candidatus Binataceae bacterium]
MAASPLLQYRHACNDVAGNGDRGAKKISEPRGAHASDELDATLKIRPTGDIYEIWIAV